MFYGQCCLQVKVRSQWRWWSKCRATLLDNILQGEKESMFKKIPHLICSFCSRFLGPCATKAIIFGDTRTGSKSTAWPPACSRMHFWEKQGEEFSFLPNFLKGVWANPSRPRKKPYSLRGNLKISAQSMGLHAYLQNTVLCQRWWDLHIQNFLENFALSETSREQSDWSTGRCFFLTFWICMLEKYKPYLFTSRTCDTRTLQVQEWIELYLKGSR